LRVTVAGELLPAHLPLPAKIRTRLQEPIELDDDPERENDKQYVQQIYSAVERVLQQGVNDLASRSLAYGTRQGLERPGLRLWS
jgi:hypothetical protein